MTQTLNTLNPFRRYKQYLKFQGKQKLFEQFHNLQGEKYLCIMEQVQNLKPSHHRTDTVNSCVFGKLF